jgi:hypothetical protein
MTTTPLRHVLPLIAIALGLLAPVVARAAVAPPGPGQLVPVDDKTDASWLEGARAAYPIDTCVVSGESLGLHGHGKQTDMIYREPGKPDRLVRFCCKGCISDFRKDPQKFLKVLDDAGGRKAGS